MTFDLTIFLIPVGNLVQRDQIQQELSKAQQQEGSGTCIVEQSRFSHPLSYKIPKNSLLPVLSPTSQQSSKCQENQGASEALKRPLEHLASPSLFLETS